MHLVHKVSDFRDSSIYLITAVFGKAVQDMLQLRLLIPAHSKLQELEKCQVDPARRSLMACVFMIPFNSRS